MKRIILLSLAAFLPFASLRAQTTPLTRAIRLEKFDEAKAHLNDELVNRKDAGGETPLQYAIYTGNASMIKALLAAGADPSLADDKGRNPLYTVSTTGDVEIAKLLIEAGAELPDVDSVYQPIEAILEYDFAALLELMKGKYPDLASAHRFEQIEDIRPRLLPWSDRWSEVRGKNNGFKPFVLRRPDEVRYARSRTPLEFCIRHGKKKCAKFLVSGNPDLSWRVPNTNYYDPYYGLISGASLLGLACLHEDCSLDIVKALLEMGQDPFERAEPKSHFMPNCAFEYAIFAGSMDKVRLILS